MAASWRGVPILMIAALMLFAFGGLIHIIGLATPYWHETTVTNAISTDYKIGHYGLWVTCSVAALDSFDCVSHDNTVGGVRDYIVATRAMVILGLLFGMCCIIVTGIWRFGMPDSFRVPFMVTSLTCGFLAALFSFIGIIIYAAEINNNEKDNSIAGTQLNNTLAWSFALCTVSSCIAFIATILLGIGIRQIEK